MPARQCTKDFKKPMNYRLKYTVHYLPAENTAKSMKFTLFQITTLRLMLQLHRVSHKKYNGKLTRTSAMIRFHQQAFLPKATWLF